MIDQSKVRLATRMLLEGLGQDPDSDALRGTPDRVARAWAELLSGQGQDVGAVLATTFEDRYDEVVALRGVPFYSMCEHHLLPFHGAVAVAYVPGGGRVVGLSKLARLVECHARRLQLQERMTRDIARDLGTHLNPKGAAVIVRAHHLCMCARGVQKPGAEMITSEMVGVFRDKPEARHEVLALLR